MRILINALSARLGGGQTYLRHLLLNAPAKGLQIYLLCPDSFDLSGMPENVQRIEIGQNLSNPYKRAIWENLRLGALARRIGAELLFCPGGLLPSFGVPSSLKTVVTFQNMLPYDHEQRKRYPWGLRRIRDWLLERGLTSSMRKADLVIFISRFAYEFIQSRIGQLRGRHAIIPHGIDQRFFPLSYKRRPRPEFAPQGNYYLYVSFVDFYKSQIEVVQAFSSLRQEGVVDGKLILAGAGYEPYQLALLNEIARLGLETEVIVSGNLPHDELPALYQSATINIFASRTENCPNILMELMASGRPALVSDFDPMPEFAGDTVRYFNPADVKSLVIAWREVMEDYAVAEKLALRAQARISSMTWAAASYATWQSMHDIGSEVDI